MIRYILADIFVLNYAIKLKGRDSSVKGRFT